MPEHTIAENLARLQAAKTAIGNAIVAKGGTVNSGDGLEEYPTDIASIETAELTSISITANGVYDTGSTTSGYNHVDVNVPNTYSSSDEGKVVNNGALVSQTAKPTEITVNDTYDTTMYNSVTVDVANTYTVEDEGKVVSNGALVAQTAKPTEITSNNTYDTTNYNSVTVDVPNTYTQSDEGKVVSNGALVAQTTKPDMIAENGVYNTTLYNSVNVNISPELSVRKDVNFYDYDGTIIKSYTAAEFANISELPDNPSHEGLTAQGWNWSLSDAKTYVAKYGKLNIGQMYVTSDGKTRIYITLTEGRISPILQLYLNSNSELDIDWGDGSTHSTFTSTSIGYRNERHNYAIAGDYVIAITVISGSFELQSSNSNVSSILWNGNNREYSPDKAYGNSIKKIEIGTGMTEINMKAFYSCHSLTTITIPNSVDTLGQDAFYACNSLEHITIPNSVVQLCPLSRCFALKSIALPNSIISIPTSCFNFCYSLASITIPDSVTSISPSAFTGCGWLSVTIPDSVTSIGSNAFSSSSTLASVTIPDSVTSLDDKVFYDCWSLTSVTIGKSVSKISNQTFYDCYSLASITIPDSVTSIGSQAFYNCSYLESIKFTSRTPPTVSNSNAWQNVPTSCTIYVPTGTLYTYKLATNYPSSSYTYVEY